MQATLRSNSGEAEFTLELETVAEYAHEVGFESTISLRGQHWDGDHTFPFSSKIDGLWLRGGDLNALSEHITKWINLPIGQLAPDGLTGDFQMARLPEQSLSLRFSSRSNEVSSMNPIVSITFKASAYCGEFYFVTDQSCLSFFVHELRAALLGANEHSL